ncbi:MAG: fluoride efflux transporter CrcB [Acidisphaera sp.]|nr:fluoride efflux transporter CrcB [Acidisphaera sp.]
MTYVWVAIGSALGGMARFFLTMVTSGFTLLRFPWGTLLVNVLGSLVIGWFGALTGPGGRIEAPLDLRIFVMVGVCGGFTTFSSFSLQTLELLRGGALASAAGYILASVILCLLAVWAGVVIGRL